MTLEEAAVVEIGNWRGDTVMISELAPDIKAPQPFQSIAKYRQTSAIDKGEITKIKDEVIIGRQTIKANDCTGETGNSPRIEVSWQSDCCRHRRHLAAWRGTFNCRPDSKVLSWLV